MTDEIDASKIFDQVSLSMINDNHISREE